VRRVGVDATFLRRDRGDVLREGAWEKQASLGNLRVRPISRGEPAGTHSQETPTDSRVTRGTQRGDPQEREVSVCARVESNSTRGMRRAVPECPSMANSRPPDAPTQDSSRDF
jgi:hypothetical protein